MPKASELKRGMAIDINGIPHAVKNLEARIRSTKYALKISKQDRNWMSPIKVMSF
jgi:translation elongation factor P/translation initiation factor 5A